MTRGRRREHLVSSAMLVGVAVALTVVAGNSKPARPHHASVAPRAATTPATPPQPSSPAPPQPSSPARSPSSTPRPPAFAVGLRVVQLVDRERTIALPGGGRGPRTLPTYVRYPALGAPGGPDVPDAPPARAYGPFPVIVFGHGFAVTPARYALLLARWASAGYVVAAPLFPLERAGAPGGPNEADLVNQPADMAFVISRLVAAGGRGWLSGTLDPGAVAVAGQSDGGDTALAVAYDPRFRDRSVGAAIILSGAEIPGTEGFSFPPDGPPLLAIQGTADTVNPPSLTDTFFNAASRPKFLLRLLGAEHLPPYTHEQPQLGIVEGVSIAFLDHYLKRQPDALRRMSSLGEVPGTASLRAAR